MSTEVILTLPDYVYEQAQQIARDTQRDINEVLTDALVQTMQPFPVNENREAMLREIEAYKAMHSYLVQHYLAQYVAIYKGQLVDYDADPVALLRRVKKQYPDQVVLRRKVEKQPEIVLHFRSPRFITTE